MLFQADPVLQISHVTYLLLGVNALANPAVLDATCNIEHAVFAHTVCLRHDCQHHNDGC